MRRTQVQLDEETYAALRRRAYDRGCSVSAVVRELLTQALGRAKGRPHLTLTDFSFVASGRSSQGTLAPVSERHDEAFVDAVQLLRRQ